MSWESDAGDFIHRLIHHGNEDPSLLTRERLGGFVVVVVVVVVGGGPITALPVDIGKGIGRIVGCIIGNIVRCNGIGFGGVGHVAPRVYFRRTRRSGRKGGGRSRRGDGGHIIVGGGRTCAIAIRALVDGPATSHPRRRFHRANADRVDGGRRVRGGVLVVGGDVRHQMRRVGP